jgi:hypothetical protein
MVHFEDRDAMFVEIRDDNHPEYEFTENDSPRNPTGYKGTWMITAEDPPRWEFVGQRAKTQSGRKAKPSPEANRQRETPVTDQPEIRESHEGQPKRPSPANRGQPPVPPNDPESPGDSSHGSDEGDHN